MYIVIYQFLDLPKLVTITTGDNSCKNTTKLIIESEFWLLVV